MKNISLFITLACIAPFVFAGKGDHSPKAKKVLARVSPKATQAERVAALVASGISRRKAGELAKKCSKSRRGGKWSKKAGHGKDGSI